MAHVHLPDGVIPLRWCLLGFALYSVPLTFGLKRLVERPSTIPLVGTLAAVSFGTMQVPVVCAHLMLTPLTGIVLGPRLSAVSVFVVDTACALMGHGGVTVVGINSVLNWSEAAGGWSLYRILTEAGLKPERAALVATGTVLSCTAFVPPFVMAAALNTSPYPFLLTLTPFWILTAWLEALVTSKTVAALVKMNPEWVLPGP